MPLLTTFRALVALALGLLCLSSVQHVFAQEVPFTLRAAILLRALQYEKGYASAAEPAKILVVGTGKSAAEAAAVADALKQLGASAGRKVNVVKHDKELTADALKAASPKVVYIATGSDSSLALARGQAAIVLCGDPRNVGKGCVLSVESAGQSSRLVVDLAEAQRQGLRFDARMLSLARVIR